MEEEEERHTAYDDVTGDIRNPQEVMEVTFQELEYIDNKGVWNDWLLGDGVFSNIRYRF